MGEALQLILLLVAIIAGAIAIFFSFQLMKQHPLPFVNSYFYYLVFLYIFSVYSLIGSGILEHLFTRMGIELKTIRSAVIIMIFLGIPFLALSKYMLLKAVLEYFKRKIVLSFIIFYFLAAVAVLVIYGIFIVRFTRFDHGDYLRLIRVQQWMFTGFFVLMYSLVYLVAMLHSAKAASVFEKQFIRTFVGWYLLFMVLCCTTFQFLSLHPLVPIIFIFLFLSWHLIPILFLNLYLGKYNAPAAGLQDDFETRLEAFGRKYEISSREKEVIRLLCRGFTNKEIGETLFISLQTVKDHIHHIFVKTGVRNRVQLINMTRSV
jgi:DNA-binding CsgD family transcriptional regulator